MSSFLKLSNSKRIQTYDRALQYVDETEAFDAVRRTEPIKCFMSSSIPAAAAGLGGKFLDL